MTTTVVYADADDGYTNLATPASPAAGSPYTDYDAAIVHVQSKVANNTGANSVSATFDSTPTSGNLLVACVATGVNEATTGPSGWTLRVSRAGSGRRAEIWTKTSDGSESGALTWSWTTASDSRVTIHELDRARESGTTGSNAGTGVTSLAATSSPGSHDPLEPAAIFVAVALSGTGSAGSPTWSWDNSFTETTDDNLRFSSAYRLYTSDAVNQTSTATWTTSRNAVSCQLSVRGFSLAADTASTLLWIGCNDPTAMYQGFLRFDTSTIGDGDNITSVTLDLYLDTTWDFTTDNFTVEARVDDTWLGTWGEPWVGPSGLGGDTLLASYATSGISGSGYKTFTSETAFLTEVDKTGSTYLSLSSDHYRTESCGATAAFLGFNSADATGTTTDPKLTVIHAATSSVVNGGVGAAARTADKKNAVVSARLAVAAGGRESASKAGTTLGSLLASAAAGLIAAAHGAGATVALDGGTVTAVDAARDAAAIGRAVGGAASEAAADVNHSGGGVIDVAGAGLVASTEGAHTGPGRVAAGASIVASASKAVGGTVSLAVGTAAKVTTAMQTEGRLAAGLAAAVNTARDAAVIGREVGGTAPRVSNAKVAGGVLEVGAGVAGRVSGGKDAAVGVRVHLGGTAATSSSGSHAPTIRLADGVHGRVGHLPGKAPTVRAAAGLCTRAPATIGGLIPSVLQPTRLEVIRTVRHLDVTDSRVYLDVRLGPP